MRCSASDTEVTDVNDSPMMPSWSSQTTGEAETPSQTVTTQSGQDWNKRPQRVKEGIEGEGTLRSPRVRKGFFGERDI